MAFHLILPLALTWAFLSLPYANGLLVNITVDDALPDPVTGNTFTYTPDGKWNVGNQCPSCLAQPNVSSLLYGTWHDATWDPTPTPNPPPTAQIQFNGTAVYVFGMLSESGANFTSTTDISFYVDGKLSGNFTYTPSGVDGFLYNISLFSKTGLDSGFHTFVLQNGGGSIPSLVLFDYMVYSQEHPDPPASSSSSSMPSSTSSSSTSSSPASTSPASTSDNHARTIALAVAIPCGVALLALVAWLLYRRSARHQTLQRRVSLLGEDPIAADVEPFPPNDNPAMRLAAVSATSKDHAHPTVRSVSYLNETPSQTVNDLTARPDTAPGSSDFGSSWQDMPMASRSHPDAPPAYDALSSTG